jgi:hypothetical protein
MIGDLLKQLSVALPRYAWYRVQKIFGMSPSAPPVGLPEPSVEPGFDTLINAIGLDPRYARRMRWPTHRSEVLPEYLLADPLYKLWATTSGGQKFSHYFSVYRKVFEPLRSLPLRVLEIGVLQGSSLKMWKQYFAHRDTEIIGIDIDPNCKRYDAPADRIHVRIGSQDDPVFLEKVVAEFGRFDLIIDDGSHQSSHIIGTFNYLFADGLQESGIYFVEDLHANYWRGWRDSKSSFLDICKDLLEHMNSHYQDTPPGAFLVETPSAQPMDALLVPAITTMIEEIRFFDSIVAIYKAKLETVPFLVRGA